VYLTDELMCRVASDIQGKSVAEVKLHDVLRGCDATVSYIAAELAHEATQQTVGGPLYAEALAVQLAVHLLRTYATCQLKVPGDACRLSEREMRLLEDYVDAHLHHSITLEDLAQALGMGVWTLNRHLRRTQNASAYAFVVERRIRRAKELLGLGDLSLKEIAATVGFSDQAHMTRMFRAKLGMTPGQYRKQI
jgi:AraC family transcriptional regulator